MKDGLPPPVDRGLELLHKKIIKVSLVNKSYERQKRAQCRQHGQDK